MKTVLSLCDGRYEITSDGHVFSNKNGKKIELVGKVSKTGYRTVLLYINKKRIYKNVHRLIGENFISNPLNKREINHIDGNKLNNSADNLEWVSTRENQIHARNSGLCKSNKIDMNIASKIRELYMTEKYSHRELAKMFGIKKTNVGYIIANKRWTV
jgi:hypothetical protein